MRVDCERCGEPFRIEDVFILPDGSVWCPKCGDEYKLYTEGPECFHP
jgi:uncharacterized Zn-finger protein